MILMLDNHDSFVHNLARYFRRLGETTEVIRSDAIDAAGCLAKAPLAIVISPGPKRPEEAGCSLAVIRELGPVVPILGVCLGHQAIGLAYGADVVRCEPCHGRGSVIDHDGTGLFERCRQRMIVGRYHSLAVAEPMLPECLRVTAWTAARGDDSPRIIMGLQHRRWPVHGVQFHPESVLTEDGSAVLANFVAIARRCRMSEDRTVDIDQTAGWIGGERPAGVWA